MDITTTLRELGEIDVSALRDAILGLDDAAWADQEYRQQTYEVHRQTASVVMLFTDGSGWPEIEVRKEPGWDALAPSAVPLMEGIIARHYPLGGTVIRAMAARLVAGGVIRPHRDSHTSFHHAHRIHVPVVTNPRVRFMIDGKPHRLQVGQAYEINNQMNHSVMNRGTEDRITFIFDYMPATQVGRVSLG
jgi:quercetin dioxygenase-like cupin family protein